MAHATHAKHRNALPQLGETRLLTDGGLETTLIFLDGMELPCFASFDLLRTAKGKAHLEAYYRRYAELAAEKGVGFVLDSPTWRASSDWGKKLGYSADALDAINREAIQMLLALRERFEAPGRPHVVSGNIGPRGDGYSPDFLMTEREARDYHTTQIRAFAEEGADMVTAMTMTHTGEAAGVASASAQAGLPVAISFTVETDGRLPTGQELGEAIAETDALSLKVPTYYMINCAHPDHFRDAVSRGEDWTKRIRGVRANASRMSHAELDNAEELDDGNPLEFGREHGELLALLPNLRVFGGCCGTDDRHVNAIADNCCHHRKAA
ncbi:homocysteine S-methyltransferase family protein [Tepidamorphus sp. 3E244]|uniref:homocysteine S-methyltransferase family protein n=1 Tax=Tepidamorphus sp. 3E244 TaxID=3385498 RepID=UPI0038FC8BA4